MIIALLILAAVIIGFWPMSTNAKLVGLAIVAVLGVLVAVGVIPGVGPLLQ